MHTFDTCESCGTYYATQDRSILPNHYKDYIPQAWIYTEDVFQGIPSPEGDISSFGQCHICDEIKDLCHRFTV